MLEIHPGPYTTRDGYKASVYNLTVDIQGREVWIGTIQDVGINSWDKCGKDTEGYTAFDLVAERKNNVD